MTSLVEPSGRSVTVNARLDQPLSRWLWLVKWLLLIPHFIVLVALWIAFAVVTVIAFFSILFVGKYPHSLFHFNLGVLRWSWRVGYYGYSNLGTDRYPPFTLGEAPDYPATLDISYPSHLSRGLVLVKSWLLALPHYVILAFIVGGTSFVIAQGTNANGAWTVSLGTGGLLGVIVFFAAVALLFTRTYPQGIYDLAVGFMRWVFRVVAYAALMTDDYPPFRLDQGGSEIPGFLDPQSGSGSAGAAAPNPGVGNPNQLTHGDGSSPNAVGPIIALIIGVLVLLPALGLTAAGGAASWLNSQRDSSGFVSTDSRLVQTPTAAATLEGIDIAFDRDAYEWAIPDDIGLVRVTATSNSQQPVFVGLGAQSAIDSWLGDIAHSKLTAVRDGLLVFDLVPGLPTAAPPAQQPIWDAQAVGTGTQTIQWPMQSGTWALVIANADGTPGVNADVSVGTSIPSLAGLGLGLIIAGLLAGLIAVGLIILGAAGLGRWASGSNPPAARAVQEAPPVRTVDQD